MVKSAEWAVVVKRGARQAWLVSRVVGSKMFKSIWVVIIFAFFFVFPVTSTATPSIRIVNTGKPLADIVLSEKASDQIRLSAELLRDYVEKASEATLSIITVAEAMVKTDKKVNIWIGPSKYVSNLKLDLEGLDGDGFVIAFPNRQNIVIIGTSDWGSEFGVYEFLERYLGVRWLLPGPDGEHVPKKGAIKVTAQEVRQEPAFFSRQLSGLPNEIQTQWARRNRMHGRVSFHHNLGKLFPPGKYQKTDPHFFAVRSSQLPIADSDLVSWQPCFSAKGIVEEAIKNINKYFDEYPNASSYSLGINDSFEYCKSDLTQIDGGVKKNLSGFEDISESYYKWANAVVEGVLKKHPTKWFGLLAYREVSDPPTNGTLHARIIPFITEDRMRWVDEKKKLKGEEITELWSNSATNVGWYDYIYGSPYMVPRVYFHVMQRYYKYALTKSVKAMYAEAYPNWGEGPKLYVALKLQWDPNLNLDELLMDWYVNAVGRDAADDLKNYYELWEQFWSKIVTKSDWFAIGKHYLPFHSSDYLNLVELEKIYKSRSLLESVVGKARTEKQRSRAKIILEAFEYYEASVLSHKGLVERNFQPERGEEHYKILDKERYLFVEKYSDHQVLSHPLRFERFEGLKW